MIDRDVMGDTIRRLRHNAGLTQQQLGDKLGVSNVAISQLETGTSMPGLTLIAEVANALGTTVGAILGEGNPALNARISGLQREISTVLRKVTDLVADLAEASERLERAMIQGGALLNAESKRPPTRCGALGFDGITCQRSPGHDDHHAWSLDRELVKW